CDGGVEKDKIAYSSKSEVMIRQIQHLLLRFGIVSILKKIKKRATNGKKEKQTYWLLCISGNKDKKIFRDKIGFFIEEKHNKIKIPKKANTNIDIIPLPAKKGTHTIHQTREKTENKLLANSDIFWDRIEKKEKLKGEFVVWDIGMETSHNFICNDFVAHNSYCCINTIKQETKDFIYKSGYTTPLSLYQFLYNNKDKLIVLDDIEGIFKDSTALSILKGALWDIDGKRLVQYDTTSNKISAPSTFEFTGRLIILCNKIPNEDDMSVNAMLSRTNHYRISFTYNQKMKLIKLILKKHKDLSDKQRKEVLRIIKKNTDVATENLNFRTLEKLISFVKYNIKKAEELFIKTTDTNPYQKIVWDLMNSGKSVNQQIQEFYEKTGKRRSKYYEVKKEVKLKMGKDKIDYIEVR
ncbi:MAG: LAGLIDADG family homing endonuclease, partial [Elusimicrobiota bacterium]